jgi:hypothetical protein
MINMQFIQLLSAILTLVIAIVTTYIAIQQHRMKFVLEMFEKRYAVYQGVKNFILSAVRYANLSNDDFFKFNEETQDAFFLFDESAEKYIDNLRSKGAKLRYLNEKLSDQNLLIGEERGKLTTEEAELNIWFGNQLLESKQVFKKYLHISQ